MRKPLTFALAWGIVLALACWAPQALAAPPACGDGKCSGKETAESCPEDCSAGPVCGDGVCDPGEDCSSCGLDCGACPPGVCNDDGVCNAGEDCLGCADCPGRTGGNPKNRFCCGLDTCETNVCGANACSAIPECGNGLIEYSEECDDGNLQTGDGCDAFCFNEPIASAIPANQFNIGDSIGEGEAAYGTIGATYHQVVWSTGYDGGDVVNSLNERFTPLDAAYTPNSSSLDPLFNQAISGSVMADFDEQAVDVLASAASVPGSEASMVTVLLGNNDVCANTLSQMTDPALFEAQYRAGLDVLAAAPNAADMNVMVSGIPAIYWLWEAKRTNFLCRVIWPFVPCQNLLSDAADDCESTASRLDPDNIYPGDGSACVRRKTFHAEIRDTYNPILRDVLAEYRDSGALPNADYVDILDVRFGSTHVNNDDCFHPSAAGHALMGEEQWCRSRWGAEDAQCTP